MNMDLITKIVILATAVVGLYKAATYKISKPAVSTHEVVEGKKLKKDSIFTDLHQLVGRFLFMLAFPAFMFGFMWVMQTGKALTYSQISKSDSNSIVLPESSSPSELAYIAATKIPRSDDEGNALAEVVRFAILMKDYKIAIMAAAAIQYQDEKGKQLMLVVHSICQKDTSIGN